MTSLSVVEFHSHVGNPIDLVEEIVVANDWAHDRASEEELIVEISGRWCDYRMYFLWQEELSALHFSCGFDMRVPKRRRGPLYELLALRPAFEASDRLCLIERVLHEAPPRLRKLNPHLPRDLETIVLKAMARDPADTCGGPFQFVSFRS